jgi:flagellar motor switch protein FliG
MEQEAKSQPAGGVFLNGKSQIIEMLGFMSPNERETLLNNIRRRNPNLADELTAHSLDFSSISRLKDSDIISLTRFLEAPILGIALKGTQNDFQRRVLSILDRSYAEEAFRYMTTDLQNEARDVKRAQGKVIETLVTLTKKKIVIL